MHWEIWVRVIFSIIAYTSLVLLNFSMFRIPIKSKKNRVAYLGLALGVSSYYLKFVLEAGPLYSLYILILFTLILMITNKYPILYSLAVCSIGYFSYGVLDLILSVLALETGKITTESITQNIYHFIILQIAFSIVACVTSFVLAKLKVGFVFVIRKFNNPIILKPVNLLCGIILLIGIIYIQISVYALEMFTVDFYILAASVVVFTSMMWVLNKQNKKAIKSRYPSGNKE